MRNLILIFFGVWMIPVIEVAQQRGEISLFGAYSNIHVWSSLDIESHGWNASLAGNVTKHFALVADFSGYYNFSSHSYSSSYLSYRVNYKKRSYSFLFGPRYAHTIGKRWTPFAHLLLGLHRETRNSTSSMAMFNGSFGRNYPALDLGAGLDIRVSDRISIRPLQVDGLVFGNFSDLPSGYVRTSFGAVFCLSKGAKDR
jgi:hypothetical protein